MMIETMVRSRLKILLSERNTERLKAGQPALTIRDVADLANLSPSVVSGLTANRTERVDYTTLSKLCRALNCTPGDILEYIPDQAA